MIFGLIRTFLEEKLSGESIGSELVTVGMRKDGALPPVKFGIHRAVVKFVKESRERNRTCV